MAKEIWKDIEGYEGLYQVSNMGRVKSFLQRSSGKIRLLKLHNRGYNSVSLKKAGKPKWFFVHRLVATAFIPNPEHKREVNHINGNKTDNRVCNLEWVSSSENKRKGFDTGLLSNRNRRKLTYEQAEEIRKKYARGVTKYMLTKEYGLCNRSITDIINHKTYKTS